MFYLCACSIFPILSVSLPGGMARILVRPVHPSSPSVSPVPFVLSVGPLRPSIVYALRYRLFRCVGSMLLPSSKQKREIKQRHPKGSHWSKTKHSPSNHQSPTRASTMRMGERGATGMVLEACFVDFPTSENAPGKTKYKLQLPIAPPCGPLCYHVISCHIV